MDLSSGSCCTHSRAPATSPFAQVLAKLLMNSVRARPGGSVSANFAVAFGSDWPSDQAKP